MELKKFWPKFFGSVRAQIFFRLTNVGLPYKKHIVKNFDLLSQNWTSFYAETALRPLSQRTLSIFQSG